MLIYPLSAAGIHDVKGVDEIWAQQSIRSTETARYTAMFCEQNIGSDVAARHLHQFNAPTGKTAVDGFSA